MQSFCEKKISILGDSISTFPGCNPPGYAVYYDCDAQRRAGMTSAADTWWQRVLTALSASLEVNASFSGGTVSGQYFPSACLERCVAVLGEPDVILLYIGINDFFCGTSLGDFTTDLTPENGVTFREAYALLLTRLQRRFPHAQIWCGTVCRGILPPDTYEEDPYERNSIGRSLADYNEVIREMARFYGCHLADLAAREIRYPSLDGCHPDSAGMKLLSDLWLCELEKA